MTGERRPWIVLSLLVVLPLPGPSGADRASSIRAVCQRLGIGEGKVVADVGCGGGPDSFVLAAVVGPRGTVFAEEIVEAKVKETLAGAKEKKLSQVVPVLGQSDDPRLPDGLVDLVYMHFVFHHFSAPGEMLRSLWRDLKPGGSMVVVEQGRGPLRDWVSLEEREKSHHRTGETTVVRLAREAGFLFGGVLDDLWDEKDTFALHFEKPREGAEPAGDPDLPLPLDARGLVEALPFDRTGPVTLAVVALDRGRDVLPALTASLGPRSRVFDVVLEEWATSRDEVPPVPPGARVEVLRAEEGALAVPAGVRFDAVLFMDGYHRLWDPAPLIIRLTKSLSPRGFLAVVDRKGPAEEPRRLAGHRRRIDAGRVRADLEKLAFDPPLEVRPPAADRFGLLFRPRPGRRWVRLQLQFEPLPGPGDLDGREPLEVQVAGEPLRLGHLAVDDERLLRR